MIKLAFYGAAGEVTGSCYVLTTDAARIMVDAGLHQGEKLAEDHNRRMPPIDLNTLDAVVLTHAHLDHSGRLPMLVRGGYRGPIHCTRATVDVTAILLRDSAKLQAEDSAHLHRHAHRDEPPREPLYGEQDVERMLPLLKGHKYETPTPIAQGINIKFVDSGHILGAASVQVEVSDGGRKLIVVFSGDVGPAGSPILRDPKVPTPADVVLLESTYGDRDHKPLDETRAELLGILQAAQTAQSKVVIPAFAVGRTQDLLFHIGEFLRAAQLKPLNVYVDSPMATSVSNLYARYTDLYDERANELLTQHMTPLSFPGLTFVSSVEESKQLNAAKGPMVIISANGMCTGGRILHHLVHTLPDAAAHVLIVGYQGQGTLGRRLVDGAAYVRIFGHDVPVRAAVHTLGGFSAHSGQSGLVAWASAFEQLKPRMFLTHGEDVPRVALRDQLRTRLSLDPALPIYGEEESL